MSSEENGKHKKPGSKKTLLTKRETDIVILICKEYSNKQIAGTLKISPYTVETHKKAIRNKTGAFTAVGVALYAARNNIFLHVVAFTLSSFLNGELCEVFSFCITA